jgi:hypothetical protein
LLAYAYVNDDLNAFYRSNGVTGDANPYTFLASMSVVIGIYCLCFAATLFTLVIKWKHGSLWLFRNRSTLNGNLIIVNTMAMFTVWSCLFVTASTVRSASLLHLGALKYRMQIYIGLLIAALRRQVTPVPAQAIMAAIWIPMCLSLFTEAHGMAVAVFLAKERKVFGRPLQAYALNILALAFYIIEPIVLIPYFALSARATQRSLNALGDMSAWLSNQAAIWNGSAPFTLDSRSQRIVAAIVSAGSDQARYLGDGFKVFMFCIVAGALVFIPAAFAYLRLLRKQMRSHRSLHSGPPSYNEKRQVSTSSSRQSDRLESLATSYRLMSVEVCLVTFCTLAYICLNGWAGFVSPELHNRAGLNLVR